MGYRQVGGDAHFAHGDERSGECACKAEEDVAEVFLYETGDLVLSGGLHSSDVFCRWAGVLAGEDACAPGHFLNGAAWRPHLLEGGGLYYEETHPRQFFCPQCEPTAGGGLTSKTEMV